jgi:hypothetical protein
LTALPSWWWGTRRTASQHLWRRSWVSKPQHGCSPGSSPCQHALCMLSMQCAQHSACSARSTGRMVLGSASSAGCQRHHFLTCLAHRLPVQPRGRRHQDAAPHHPAHEIQQQRGAANLLPAHRGLWGAGGVSGGAAGEERQAAAGQASSQAR